MLKRYIKSGLVTMVILAFPVAFSWTYTTEYQWLSRLRVFSQNDVVTFLPYLIFGAVAFLSYQMNLRKTLFGCGYILVGLWLTTHQMSAGWARPFLIAAPISLTAIMFLRESKLLGRDGAWLSVGAALPLAALWGLHLYLPKSESVLYGFQPFKHLPLNHVPQLSLVLWTVSLVGPLFHSDRYLRRLHWALSIGFMPMFYVFEARGSSASDLSVLFAAYGLYIFASTLTVYWQKIYLDELTGIPNRRALNEALSRLTGNYTVAMVDIDHFKKFNDTHGHDHGDNVLKMVGQHVFTQSGGLAYRYGGEEFTMLFQDQLPENVFEKIDNIRKTLAERSFHLRDKPQRGPIGFLKKLLRKNTFKRGVKVNISIGVAGNPGSAKSVEEIFKAADECLYEAKENGRNCVVIYDPHRAPRKKQKTS